MKRYITLISGLAFTLLVCLVFTTPLVEMTQYGTAENRSYRIYGYAAVLTAQAVLVPLRGWKPSLLMMATPLLAAFAWFALSLTWSAHVDLTLRRLILLAAVYLGTTGAVCDLGYRKSLGIVRILLLLLLAVNFVSVLILPDLATQSARGATLWRGIMGHKNIAGLSCAALVLLFTLDPGRLRWALRLPVIVGALAFLYFSASRTPALALIVGGAFGVALSHKLAAKPAVRNRLPQAFTAAAMALAAGLLVLLAMTVQREWLVALTNDQTALSVRTMIWRPMVQFYLDNPVLGSGYGAYWDGSSQLGSNRMFGGNAWLGDVDQGHNGYLDLLVQTGFPGLALSLLAIVLWPLRRLAALHAHDPQRAALIIALIVFVMVENMAESSILADDSVGNLLLLFALAQVRRFELRSLPKRVRAGSRAAKLADAA